MTDTTSNLVTLEALDEAIRCIGLKMEVRKSRMWSPNQVMWAEIGEIQTLLDWITERRAVETSADGPALLTVLQENKRLRAALAKISCGTDDLLPPYRDLGTQGLRAIARKTLAEVQDRPVPETTGEWVPLDHDLIVNDHPVRMRRKGSACIPQWEMWRALKASAPLTINKVPQ